MCKIPKDLDDFYKDRSQGYCNHEEDNMKSVEFQQGYIAFTGIPRHRSEIKNPYPFTTKVMIKRRNEWFNGYDAAAKDYFEKTYRIPEFQARIREIVTLFNFQIKYDAEYGNPYIETSEGYVVNISEEDHQNDMPCLQ